MFLKIYKIIFNFKISNLSYNKKFFFKITLKIIFNCQKYLNKQFSYFPNATNGNIDV